ncbi:MAG: SRPBCC family protein [Pseudomonadota bacterium]
MKIHNVHERRFNRPAGEIGAFIDGLAGPADKLWPRDRWPALVLDRGLTRGSRGGHGPVRYRVEEYLPGKKASFRFEPAGLTQGFDGRHVFELLEDGPGVILRHTIDANCTWPAWLKWGLAVRPLHDALLEDTLDGVEKELGLKTTGPRAMNPWVRFLRRLVAPRKK